MLPIRLPPSVALPLLALSLLIPHELGGTPLRDPVISNGESATYRTVGGERESGLTDRVTILSEGGRQVY
jgi:hypothetical protein